MKMPPQNQIENKPSELLTEEENQKIFRLLGNKCQTIATAVIQLFATEAPQHSHWCKRDTGVICFVKDNIKKNYFFRLFCLRRNAMIWEHELYNNFEYLESTPFLHIFEGEEYMVAFNFAFNEEAKYFLSMVDHKLLARKRREEKLLKQSRENTSKTPVLQDSSNFRKVPDSAAKLAKRKRNITKADIGIPLDFKHISHVGWNPDSGFDINVQDETLKKFFEKAGVSEKQLQDRDTREFIYDFIAKHGGREAVVEQTDQTPQKPAQTDSSGPPVPPRSSVRSHHVRAAPPPPPSSKKPVAHINSAPPAPPPAPPSDFNPPIPPPPPPLPMETEYVKSESKESKGLNTVPTDLNSALMESIRGGTTLRPVEERKITPSTPPNDSRNNLLSQIRQGDFKLKPVEERDLKPIKQVVEQSGNDLAGALARALAERNKAIHSEDDDDDEDSNDDEWED